MGQQELSKNFNLTPWRQEELSSFTATHWHTAAADDDQAALILKLHFALFNRCHTKTNFRHWQQVFKKI
jgi:hypothetical protein